MYLSVEIQPKNHRNSHNGIKADTLKIDFENLKIFIYFNQSPCGRVQFLQCLRTDFKNCPSRRSPTTNQIKE